MTSQHLLSPEKVEEAGHFVTQTRQIVEGLIASLDEAFDLVAGKAPDMDARLAGLCERLFALSSSRLFDSFSGGTGTTRDAFANLDHFLERCGRRATGLVEQLFGLERNTGDIHSKLEEVVEVSDNLTLVALNARMLSSAAGTSGAAFGAITQELTAASREVSQVAREFIRAMQNIEQRLTQLQEVQKKLTETLAHVNLEAIQDVVSGAHCCHEAVHSINRHAQQTGALCGAARPVIKNLMGAIQSRDILRQSLEHIAAVGTELKEQIPLIGSPPAKGSEMASGIAFVSQGALLSRELLMDTSKEVLGFTQQLKELLDQLEAVFESLASLDELRTEDLQVAASARRGVEDLAGALGALDDLDDAVTRSQEAFEANAKELRHVSKVLSRMKKLSDTVSVIEVVMRIKTASNAILEKDAQFLAKEIRAGQEKISAALNSVHENLRSMASVDQGDALGAFRASLSELRQARARTGELENRLTGFTDELSGLLVQAVAEGGSLREHLGGLRGALGDLREHIPKISSAASSLESVATLAALQADQVGLESTDTGSAVASDRIEALVNGFTALSQKMIAASAAEIDIEYADAPGTKTFF